VQSFYTTIFKPKTIFMKKILFVICVVAFAACNNETKTTEQTKTDGTTAAEVKLPFELNSPYANWSIGSNENVAVSMNALKAFIDKDFDALASTIGDTLRIDFDNYQATLSRDSAMSFFRNARAGYGDIKLSMDDYVSVISADKKSEWVTLWYKQISTDAKGVVDSMNYVNDIRLVNGKMVQLNEKGSRFMKK
jgi:hypothetical protein